MIDEYLEVEFVGQIMDLFTDYLKDHKEEVISRVNRGNEPLSRREYRKMSDELTSMMRSWSVFDSASEGSKKNLED